MNRPGDDDDRQRQHAYRVVTSQQVQTGAWRAPAEQGVAEEQGRAAERGDHVQAGAAEQADTFEERHYASALSQQVGPVVAGRIMERNGTIRDSLDELADTRIVGF